MIESKPAYPLCWPEGKPRTRNRKCNGHFKTSFAKARDSVQEEIRLLRGTSIIISSNVPLKNNGEPYATGLNDRYPDPGVAVYFTRNGKQLCFACDCYFHIQDNLHAINLTIHALRGISRWGTGDMMESAFRGYAALPERASGSWRDVLGVAINATEEQVRKSYRDLCKQWHPDASGGDSERFREINQAWNDFKRETGL